MLYPDDAAIAGVANRLPDDRACLGLTNTANHEGILMILSRFE